MLVCKVAYNAEIFTRIFLCTGKVQEAGVSSISDYMGHPSVAKLIGEGYQVITF